MMRHYEQIVEDILTILTADADPAEEALRDVDTRYADAVNEVNERLIMCDRLLQKGHRSEAIQQGELDPKLLDLVAVLDFPELEAWGEYVREFGLAGPPDLRSAIALDLNAAYDMDAALEDLLKQHRLLALARAPLGSRLRVLREIARRDNGNPIWLEDVRSWEQVRVGQLGKELEAAAGSDDLAGIAQLDQEVRAPDWLVPPSEAIRKQIRATHGQVRARRARCQLERLERELTEAYANLDLERARKLRKQWESHASVGITRDDDPLLERAGPALNWLAEQDALEQEQAAYDGAIRRLETALNKGATRRQLEALAHSVMQFEAGLPEPLEQRVNRRFADLELASRRKTTVTLTAVVLSVLLLAVLTVWGIHSYGRQTQRIAHEQNMTELIRARRLPEARSYLDNLQQDDPAQYATPQLQNLRRDLETAEQTEAARRSRFTRLLEDARQHAESFEGYADALRSLRDAGATLEQAPEHFEDAWQQELELARSEVESSRRSKQEEFNRAWLEQFAAFQEQYQQRDRTNLDNLQSLQTGAQVLAKTPQVESRHRNQIEPLLASLEQDIDTMRSTLSERDLLQRIADAVGDRERYARSLQNYIEGFSHRPRAADFRQVLESETGYWEGMEKWQPLINRFAAIQLARTTPADAAQLIADAEPLLAEYPGFPAASAVQTRLEYLTPIRAREQADGRRLESNLIQVLDQPLVKDVLVVLHQPENGALTRYYFTGNLPEASRNRWTVTHLIETSSDRTQQIEIPDTELRNPRTDDNAIIWTSPQQAFFEYLLEQLQDLTDADWEIRFFTIITRLLADDTLDAVLKVEILRHVLTIACEGSYALQQAFGGWLNTINAAVDDGTLNLSVNWINPSDGPAEIARRRAERVLERLGGMELPRIQTQQFLREMQTAGNWPSYQWVGSLLRDDDRNWHCAPEVREGSNLPSGNLLVVHQGVEGKPGFTNVGRLEEGQIHLQRGSAGPLLEGRPLYLVTLRSRAN